MKNYLKIGLIILAILIIILGFTNFSKQFTGKPIDINYYYSFTKAICNGTNYCQDYEIVCNRNKTIGINPITGAAVQFSEDWEDRRDKEAIEKLCE